MLEALVERRAAELVNQPGPHRDKTLAALERSFKRVWSPGEPRLMITYPQLANGVVSHYPVRKRRHQRTVVNRAADGSSIRLADPVGESTEWFLQYSDLSDDEIAVLKQFFVSAEGVLNGFTFLDPAANLLARLGSDKKTIQGKVHFVLPRKIGEVTVVTGVDEQLILAAWKRIRPTLTLCALAHRAATLLVGTAT